MLTMTDKAAARVRAAVDASTQRASGLRIRVVGGGCSGLTYKLELSEERKGDKIFEHDGARLYIDRRSYLYVCGTEVDYSESLERSGFDLHNPNVKKSCGCGESFVV